MPHSPARTIRRLLAAAALLFGITAAALVLPSAATASDVPPPKTLTANRIEVVRTGGVIGTPVTWTVDAGHTGPEGARLLRTVATPEYLALKPLYGPAHPCCDFFTYTVTVTYDGDHTKTVVTSELATSVPEILTNVIRLTQRIGSSGAS